MEDKNYDAGLFYLKLKKMDEAIDYFKQSYLLSPNKPAFDELAKIFIIRRLAADGGVLWDATETQNLTEDDIYKIIPRSKIQHTLDFGDMLSEILE